MPAAGDVDNAEGNNTADVLTSTLDPAAGNAEHGPNGSLPNASSNSSADSGPAAGKPVELHTQILI
jgi:hypothetical protein